MDEPFSALDAMTRESLQDVLLQTLEDNSMTVLLVTHSIEEAAYLGGEYGSWQVPRRGYQMCFENPGHGVPGYRTDPSFFRLCAEIRRHLERSQCV